MPVSFLRILLAFLAAYRTLAATCTVPEAVSPSDFAAVSFTYIVIGKQSPTSSRGLTVDTPFLRRWYCWCHVVREVHIYDHFYAQAALSLHVRLTEDPSTVVGVIEAGALHLNDPVLDIPGMCTCLARVALGRLADWQCSKFRSGKCHV